MKNNTYSVLFYIIFLIIFCSLRLCRKTVFGRHFRKKRTAKKVYKKLHEIGAEHKDWLFSYLKKIDPFVFEELVLYAYKKKGCKVYYNKRYTHDGGIDGKVKIGREIYLIQDKRYENYINPQHVKDFSELCKKRKKYGLFVHTGKTGTEARNYLKTVKNVEIISGQKLIDLLMV